MLPKNRRISRKDVSSVFVQAKKYHSSHITLLVSGQKTKGVSQFCFSVPKKVDMTAVGRNTLRRRGYAVVWSYIHSIVDGYYCLFIYKVGSAKLSFQSIEKEVTDLLKVSSVLP